MRTGTYETWETPEKAAAAWNRRLAAMPEPEEAERMRDALQAIYKVAWFHLDKTDDCPGLDEIEEICREFVQPTKAPGENA